jgi:hypothetical protein
MHLGFNQWPNRTRSTFTWIPTSSSIFRVTTPVNGVGPPLWDPRLILSDATPSRLEFSLLVGVPGRLVGGKEFVDDQFRSP